ncbi:MAG: hypothetical protein HXX15_21145 [Rhodopseudomonas sp.]|uniref:hypothetical protein n=1 Tax=Rhodopseudomonas sp. TaxID=1078 RepID=UPI0017D2D6E6|nr:hypothetical protein [Rhodopseudomonas sp.]NVN88593.1 hypothetical protein [Rhodopseudomonas sp.]
MSAHNVVRLARHNAVILAADTAAYDHRGVVQAFASKLTPVDRWPGVIGGTGNMASAEMISAALVYRFELFDAAVAGIERELPQIVAETGLDNARYDLVLAGWSAARQRPESYNIKTMSDVPSDTPLDQVDAMRAAGIFDPYRLMELPDCVQTPTPSTALIIEASYEGFADDDTPETAIQKLRLVLEMQRHHQDRAHGLHWVGGAAEIATVTPDGVTTDFIHVWDEDDEGQLIRPMPIDWTEFRVSLGLPPGKSRKERDAISKQFADLEAQLAAARKPTTTPLVIPDGLSPLKRQMLERKQRKAKLRAV